MDSERVLHDFLYSEQIHHFSFHFHDTHEIIYICEGEICITVGKKSYQAGSGDMIFISHLEEHQVEICSPVYRRYYVQFTSAQMDQIFSSPDLRALFLNRHSGFQHCVSMAAVSEKIEKIFREICQEYLSEAIFSGQYIIALMRELFITCYREQPDYFSFIRGRRDNVILEVQQYIDKNFLEDITVEDIAAHCHFSPSYLSHVFKDWTGYSMQQYLIISRITHAKKLLLTTDSSINDISIQSGFNDVNSFIRTFKKKSGVSPGKFRKTYTKVNPMGLNWQ